MKTCTQPYCESPRWLGPKGTNTSLTMCEEHTREYWRNQAAKQQSRKDAQTANDEPRANKKPGRPPGSGKKPTPAADNPTPTPIRAAHDTMRCTIFGCPHERYISENGTILAFCLEHLGQKPTDENEAETVHPQPAPMPQPAPTAAPATATKLALEEQPHKNFFSRLLPPPPSLDAAKKQEAAPAPSPAQAATPAPRPVKQPSPLIREQSQEVVAAVVAADPDEPHIDLAAIDAAYDRIAALYR